MSIEWEIRYWAQCDERKGCSGRTGPERETVADALDAASAEHWLIGDAEYVCDWCLDERDRIACGERPDGHNWKRDWHGEVDADGWFRLDGEAIRMCLDCGRNEHKEF